MRLASLMRKRVHGSILSRSGIGFYFTTNPKDGLAAADAIPFYFFGSNSPFRYYQNGGIAFAGDAVETQQPLRIAKTFSVTGGITFGGSPTYSKTLIVRAKTYTQNGGLIFAGNPAYSVYNSPAPEVPIDHPYNGNGTVTFAGSPTYSKTLQQKANTYLQVGGITFTGTPVYGQTIQTKATSYTQAGGIVFAGAPVYSKTLTVSTKTYAQNGGLIFAGSPTYSKTSAPAPITAFTYAPNALVSFAGQASTSFTSAVQPPVTTDGGGWGILNHPTRPKPDWALPKPVPPKPQPKLPPPVAYGYKASGGMKFAGRGFTYLNSVPEPVDIRLKKYFDNAKWVRARVAADEEELLAMLI